MKPVKHRLLNPLTMLRAGLLIGLIARLLDIFTQNLGNLFSSLPVWVLLCTLIAVYSPTKKAAAMNVLPFCLGMLLTYYLTAHISGGVYGWTYILFWSALALCTPFCAVIAWLAKEPGLRGKILSVGIIVGTTIVSRAFFDKLRLHDILILALLAWVMLRPRRLPGRS